MLPFKVEGGGGGGPHLPRAPPHFLPGIQAGAGAGMPLHRQRGGGGGPGGRHPGGGPGGRLPPSQHHIAMAQQQQQLTRALSLGAQTHHGNIYREGPAGFPGLGFVPPPPLPPPVQGQKKQLSAKELTGAPLISYVPRNRKIKKRVSDPNTRIRHCSQPSYYLGQNLYRNIQIQDVYHNPVYAMQSSPIFPSQASNLRRESVVSTSCDTLSDSYSISSDDLDNFLPRIIRPRRRRKKEKQEKKKKERQSVEEREETESCLGSEKQWLPQGLLSAESSYDSRSESGSSLEDAPVHRKLGPCLSMPAYSSFSQAPGYLPLPLGTLATAPSHAATSDYSSLNSNNSDTPPTSSTDHLCDSDSSRSESDTAQKIRRETGEISAPTISVDNVVNREAGELALMDNVEKPLLKLAKSTSTSFFRSPKMASKLVGGGGGGDERSKKLLRKTNSWHPPPNQDDSRASFSLFSPAGSIDLLSGIRKNLSKMDLNNDED